MQRDVVSNLCDQACVVGLQAVVHPAGRPEPRFAVRPLVRQPQRDLTASNLRRGVGVREGGWVL